jgi:hypothetical protein
VDQALPHHIAFHLSPLFQYIKCIHGFKATDIFQSIQRCVFIGLGTAFSEISSPKTDLAP